MTGRGDRNDRQGVHALDRAVGTWVEYRATDLGLSVSGAALLFVLHRWRGWDVNVVSEMGFQARLGLYTDLITISGIFVAFSVTGLAAYLALSGSNIERLRLVADARILGQWLWAIAGTALVLLAFIVSKVFDRQQDVTWPHWLATAAFFLLVLQATRMIYVFSQLAGIATAKPYSRRRSKRRPSVTK